jgi:hypothetical protein
MNTRTTVALCVIGLVAGCTVDVRSGQLSCEKDTDCPNRFVCRAIDASQKRCVDPNSPIWQPPGPGDAAVDAGRDAGHDAGLAADASTRPTEPDSGFAARDGGVIALPDAGHLPADVDSGLSFTGGVTVLSAMPAAGDAPLIVTDAVIEGQPVLCGPQDQPLDKQLCVMGGIRP